MSTTIEEARAALNRARAEHAAAMQGVQDKPGDPEAQQQFRDVVRAGRAAWRGYQQAATAGLAVEIEAIVPDAFRD